MKRGRTSTTAAIAIGIAATFFIAIFPILIPQTLLKKLDTISSNPNPLIRRFATTWRSLKHISDVPFFAASTLIPESLPVYAIVMDPSDYTILLQRLPRYPFENYLSEEYKASVPAYFSAGSYNAKVEVRFRGVSPQHWNAYKKSWHVDLPNGMPFNALTSLRLVIPEDRKWASELLNQYRAEHLGLISPRMKFVWLYVNGERMGIYNQIEGWEPSLLIRNGRPIEGEIFSPRDIPLKNADYLRSSSLSYWETRFSKDPIETQKRFLYLLELISDADDETFVRELPTMVDLPLLYRWAVVNILAGSTHQGNIENMNFYYNPDTQLFEPISFDVSIQELAFPFDAASNRLLMRVLQHPAWHDAFIETLREYVTDTEARTNDMTYYDSITSSLYWQVMKDTRKLPTTIETLQEFSHDKNLFISNIEHVREELVRTQTIPFALQ